MSRASAPKLYSVCVLLLLFLLFISHLPWHSTSISLLVVSHAVINLIQKCAASKRLLHNALSGYHGSGIILKVAALLNKDIAIATASHLSCSPQRDFQPMCQKHFVPLHGKKDSSPHPCPDRYNGRCHKQCIPNLFSDCRSAKSAWWILQGVNGLTPQEQKAQDSR